MKILLIGPQWMGEWMKGVQNPLLHFGHEVFSFYYDYPNAPTTAQNIMTVNRYIPSFLRLTLTPIANRIGIRWEKRMNRKLISITRSTKPDLILILKGETIHAETFVEIKSTGAMLASWWLDDPVLYLHDHPQIRSQLENLDVLFMFNRGRFQELTELGAKQIEYLPCAFDPGVYHPKKVSKADINKYQCDIGLIASYYSKRGELLSHMQGFDVAVWGRGWKNRPEIAGLSKSILRGKSLNGHQIATAYNIMKICPNVHHSQSILGGLNMRAFEISGAGGFQLTDYIEGMEQHFEIGKEIIVYQSSEHFRELVDYYLAHPAERYTIAKRGHERAVRDHTYEQRLKKVFEILN